MSLIRFNDKTIHGLCLTLALAAPIVYLFGSLFFALSGAHGEQLFSDEATTQELDISYINPETGIQYTRLGYQQNYGTAVYWNQSGGEGYVNLSKTGLRFGYFQWIPWQGTILTHNEPNNYIALYINEDEISIEEIISETEENVCASMYIEDENGIDAYYVELFYSWEEGEGTKLFNEIYIKNNNVWGISSGDNPFEWSLPSFDFQYFSHIPLEKYNLIKDYIYLPFDQPYKTVDTGELKSYSNYLFGQFFAHDNFLATSGKAVLEGTENYGFQPLGDFVRYTDTNFLHLGTLPYGALAYGYAYYAAHVIILDLIMHLVLFIPRLIKRITHQIEGGGRYE